MDPPSGIHEVYRLSVGVAIKKFLDIFEPGTTHDDEADPADDADEFRDLIPVHCVEEDGDANSSERRLPQIRGIPFHDRRALSISSISPKTHGKMIPKSTVV